MGVLVINEKRRRGEESNTREKRRFLKRTVRRVFVLFVVVF